MDATFIQPASSTQNTYKARDPEMQHMREDNQLKFGMNAHIEVDELQGLVQHRSSLWPMLAMSWSLEC